jgi:hypothetical protein
MFTFRREQLVDRGPLAEAVCPSLSIVERGPRVEAEGLVDGGYDVRGSQRRFLHVGSARVGTTVHCAAANAATAKRMLKQFDQWSRPAGPPEFWNVLLGLRRSQNPLCALVRQGRVPHSRGLRGPSRFGKPILWPPWASQLPRLIEPTGAGFPIKLPSDPDQTAQTVRNQTVPPGAAHHIQRTSHRRRGGFRRKADRNHPFAPADPGRPSGPGAPPQRRDEG